MYLRNIWIDFGDFMMMLSDFVIALLKEWQIDDLPVNILIGDEYYDIEEFFFDDEIHEYILKLSKGHDYNSRGQMSTIKQSKS